MVNDCEKVELSVFSYVDRDTAISQGLAFWTGDGNPGIQVGRDRDIQ